MGSGKGDLQLALDEEFLQVPLSKKSIIQCDDRLPVSAGDADGLVGRRVRSCMKLYRTSFLLVVSYRAWTMKTANLLKKGKV